MPAQSAAVALVRISVEDESSAFDLFGVGVSVEPGGDDGAAVKQYDIGDSR